MPEPHAMPSGDPTAAATEPDWAKLQEIAAEIEDLKAKKKWNKAAFDRLMQEGQDAAAGDTTLLEFIENAGEDDW